VVAADQNSSAARWSDPHHMVAVELSTRSRTATSSLWERSLAASRSRQVACHFGRA